MDGNVCKGGAEYTREQEDRSIIVNVLNGYDTKELKFSNFSLSSYYNPTSNF